MLKNSENREFLVIVPLLAFAAVNGFWLIPEFVVAEGTSGHYPILLNWIFALLSTGYLIDHVVTRKQKKGKASRAEDQGYVRPAVPAPLESKDVGISLPHGIKVALILLSVFIWVFLQETIGFFFATFCFLCATTLIYGERNWKKIIIFSLVFPLVVLLVFLLLNATLPTGIVEETLRNLVK